LQSLPAAPFQSLLCGYDADVDGSLSPNPILRQHLQRSSTWKQVIECNSTKKRRGCLKIKTTNQYAKDRTTGREAYRKNITIEETPRERNEWQNRVHFSVIRVF